MSFPVYLDLGLVRLQPHLFAESFAYAFGLWRVLSHRGYAATQISKQNGFSLLL